MIKVDTKTKELGVLGLDIFSSYILALQRCGKDDVFLLESCSGPDIDCRESILGIDGLATMQFYRDRLEIAATLPLQEAIESHLNNAFGEQRFSAGVGRFTSSDELWMAFKSITTLFSKAKENSTFSFGFLTCLSYDAGFLIEELPQKIQGQDSPLIFLRLFRSFLTVSKSGDVQISVTNSDLFPEPIIDIEKEILPKFAIGDRATVPLQKNVVFSTTKDEYIASVKIALDHIREGDIYQVQIGHQVSVKSEMEPHTLYRRLRELNPSPYMFLCNIGDHQLIGASPENYIRMDADGLLMRPIAGTISKNSTKTRIALVEELTGSKKECAEHIMLVDLCRNDMSRVAKTNSLDVKSLMAVEEFSHLYHLVSTVSCAIPEDKDVVDMIEATFPAGTMTGAPKIRAMEIIENLETSRRGAYAGSVGLIGAGGKYANLALNIRMASYKNNTYYLRASAGVVADSSPENEWKETLVKMGAVYKALTNEELVA